MSQTVRLTDLQDSDTELAADPLTAPSKVKEKSRGQLRKSKSDAESHLSKKYESDESDEDDNLFHFSPTLTPSPSYSNPKEEKSHRASLASSISEFFGESKSKVSEKSSDPTGLISTSSEPVVRPDRLSKTKILPALQAHLQSPRAAASIDTFSNALNAGANFIRKRKGSGSKKKKGDKQENLGSNMEEKVQPEDVKNLSTLQQKFDILTKKFDSLKSKNQTDKSLSITNSGTNEIHMEMEEKIVFVKNNESVKLIPPHTLPMPSSNVQNTVTVADKGQSAGTPSVGGKSAAKSLTHGSSIPQSLFLKYYRHIFGVLLLIFTLCFDTPGFVCGLLWGVYLSVLAVMFFSWLFFPTWSVEDEEISVETTETALTETELAEAADFKGILYRGWMNELTGHYNPGTHHVNHTKSVFVRLDHSILRLSRPKQNISRHAFWQELRHEPAFVSQKMFDITGATVALRPKNLARRRWWSRKYPICVIVQSKAELVSGDPKLEEKINVKETPSKEETVKDDTDGTDADVDTDAVSAAESDFEEVEDDEFLELKSTANLVNPNCSACFGTAQKRSSVREKRKIIYLFARSAREKEFWFQRLKRAACHYAYERDPNHHLQLPGVKETESPMEMGRSRTASTSEFHPIERTDNVVRRSMSSSVLSFKRHSNCGQQPEMNIKEPETPPPITEWILYASLQQKYNKYMSKSLYDKDKVETEGRPREIVTCDLSSMIWKIEEAKSSEMNIAWANAFAARIFWDFTRDQVWIGRVRDRVQRKLSTIRLPYFIETLTLTKLEPAMCVPKINSVSEPVLNDWGLWVDLGMIYAGGLQLVLETKVNIMKLKDQGSKPGQSSQQKPSSTRYSDNELPESPESSADEEPPMISIPILSKKDDGGSPKQSAGKKILQMVDTVTHSKYFEKLTDINIVKRWMQDVSETRLILMVQLKYLEGTLCLNIPPPPTDRIWYGFRAVPTITLRAYPKLGEKPVNFSPLTEWIETKMKSLFEKNLVIPNMDDFVVPLMHGSPLLSSYNM